MRPPVELGLGEGMRPRIMRRASWSPGWQSSIALTFGYEAGPTGYGLQRLIESLDHTCLVLAPSLIPKKVGDRVTANRRNAEGLARLLRAGELKAVWNPDARHEAMRPLGHRSRRRNAMVIWRCQRKSDILF